MYGSCVMRIHESCSANSSVLQCHHLQPEFDWEALRMGLFQVSFGGTDIVALRHHHHGSRLDCFRQRPVGWRNSGKASSREVISLVMKDLGSLTSSVLFRTSFPLYLLLCHRPPAWFWCSLPKAAPCRRALKDSTEVEQCGYTRHSTLVDHFGVLSDCLQTSSCSPRFAGL